LRKKRVKYITIVGTHYFYKIIYVCHLIHNLELVHHTQIRSVRSTQTVVIYGTFSGL